MPGAADQMSSYAWILVADSARARFFSVDSATAPLKAFDQIVHPEGRLHDKDMTSDRPGRAFDSSGEGRHATGSSVSPKEQESVRFAKTIASYLDQGRVNNSYGSLVLVADPRFLGHIRDAVPSEVAKLVSLEVNKDLSKAKEGEIRKHLPEQL